MGVMSAVALAWLALAVGAPTATATAASVERITLEADSHETLLRLHFAPGTGHAHKPLAMTAHDEPRRLRIDFERLTWPSVVPPPGAGAVTGLRHGLANPVRSRLVVALAGPALPAGAQIEDDVVTITLRPAAQAAFNAAVAASLPAPAAPLPRPTAGLRVALDPGHGGRDPGAVWTEEDCAQFLEKALVLAHAQALATALRELGHAVALTRDDDSFLPLGLRVARAQQMGADVFLSLHADAAPQPDLSGASVYTLSPVATDARAAALAARENGAESALATAFPDAEADVAAMLTALVRGSTARRAQSLGAAIAASFAREGLALPSRPLRAAGFAVLRAPEVPSALIELGFLSSAADRARLTDPAQRDRITAAIARAVHEWATQEPATRSVPRRP